MTNEAKKTHLEAHNLAWHRHDRGLLTTGPTRFLSCLVTQQSLTTRFEQPILNLRRKRVINAAFSDDLLLRCRDTKKHASNA